MEKAEVIQKLIFFTTDHLVCMRTRCLRKFRKTGSPSHNLFVVKTLKNLTLQILYFVSVS